ncbi:dephospho-CoA kinase [Pannonibacter indicus]|jgi:dephospho-CoA kinase|uniref:Dephospho-CoA kinase n=1 Tax=Pannonibacter indicus TaxID=466044 RepID=A0A0K6HS89_9HYPH|nr:dephospho-CoA kinase [Pannonibacter indicus]CUA93628.1 dephospho-CoA kinase [Pannonibacter indicus]
MIRLGLTGSIAMGKSATAKMFAEAGVPVHDADAAVHALYAGRAVPLIEAAFPGTTAEGKVDRTRLGEAVLGKQEAIARLEAIIHPLVHEAEASFLSRARAEGRRMVVLDIPLLFETGGERRMDAVVVVSAPAEVQRERALARPGMTVQRLDAILARQMPDADKRRRSHFIIETGSGLEPARRAVRSVIRALSGKA